MNYFDRIEYRFIYFICIIFILQSCSKKNDSDNLHSTQRKITYKDILQPSIKLSELFNTYDFIVLDASEGSPMIGEITKITEFNNRIIVFDKQITNSVFVYDSKGKYIFRTNKGEGPTEVLSIDDFSIDEINNQLFVLDNGSMSIKKYDLNNGNFISSFKLNDIHVAMSNLNNNSVLLSNSFLAATNSHSNSKIISLDLVGEPGQYLKNYIPVTFEKSDSFFQFLDSGIGFIKFDSTTLFSEGFGNKIYQLSNTDGSVLSSLEIDFGKNGLDNFAHRVNSLDDLDHVFEFNSLNYIIGTGNARSADKAIYLVSNGGPIHYLFVDHDLSYLVSYENIYNDLFDMSILFFVGNSNAYTYSYFPPEVVVNMIDNSGAVDDKLKRVIGPDFNVIRSNPVLVKLYNQ